MTDRDCIPDYMLRLNGIPIGRGPGRWDEAGARRYHAALGRMPHLKQYQRTLFETQGGPHGRTAGAGVEIVTLCSACSLSVKGTLYLGAPYGPARCLLCRAIGHSDYDIDYIRRLIASGYHPSDARAMLRDPRDLRLLKDDPALRRNLYKMWEPL